MDATPQPRKPWTTKLTARRFGQRMSFDPEGADLGQHPPEQLGREVVEQPARRRPPRRPTARRWRPPPLSPERAPTRTWSGTVTVSAAGPDTASGSGSGPGCHAGRRPDPPISPGGGDGRRRHVDSPDAHLRGDRRGRHRGRPVAGHTLGARRRRGEEGARVAREARLHDGAGEGPSDGPLVVPAHRQAQIRQATAVEVPRELCRRFGEGGTTPGDAGPHGVGGEARLLRHLRPRQGQGHGVAPPPVEVGRHLERRRRRLAPHAADPHPVRAVLGQLDAVEARHGVRAEVARAADLVEQLRRHRSHRDGAPGPRVLGHHRAPVGVHLGDGEADPLSPWDLVEEGVVAAAALRPALNDVARHHRAGDGVELVVLPPEGVQRRAHDEGGVGHPAGDDDLRAGRQRVGDRTGPQVRVGGDHLGTLGELLGRVEVHEALAGRSSARPGVR